jgi:hypothetical protein
MPCVPGIDIARTFTHHGPAMTTLRILVDGMPDADRAFAWALVDGARVRERGSPPRGWPRADATVAIVDAPLVHVAALALPPIPGSRLDDAVRYALDDQLAAAADTLHIARGPQRADGRVVAVAASRALVEAIDARLPRGARIVALPTLLPAAADWQWALDDDGHGFLARPDGSAIAVASAPPPPAEIVLALNHARRTAAAPARIVVHGRDAAAALPATSIDGVALVHGATFAWDGSGAIGGDPAAVPDLRPHAARAGPVARHDARRAWRPSLALAAAALAFFVLAGLGTWAHDALARWQDEREALALAREVGAPARDFAGAMQAIAARYAASRHAARQPAPSDALTLLARAAPALAAVPAGQWKRATYASGAWTFEFGALGEGVRDALVARLTAAGVTALAASSASGVRVRIEA